MGVLNFVEDAILCVFRLQITKANPSCKHAGPRRKVLRLYDNSISDY
jgi:hypothetical protein